MPVQLASVHTWPSTDAHECGTGIPHNSTHICKIHIDQSWPGLQEEREGSGEKTRKEGEREEKKRGKGDEGVVEGDKVAGKVEESVAQDDREDRKRRGIVVWDDEQ